VENDRRVGCQSLLPSNPDRCNLGSKLTMKYPAVWLMEEGAHGEVLSIAFANKGQLQDAWIDGFERVIYLAFSDHDSSLEGEDRTTKELGMEYVNIPVNWGSPTPEDFALFAAIMRSAPEKKTLLHCQVNYRASSFSFLYRVIYDDVSVKDAKADLDSVWTPNSIWTTLIQDVLTQHGISSNCEDCDWTPEQH